MSRIVIHHPHTLGQEQAQARVAQLAADGQARWPFVSQWQDNTLHFQRSGVQGWIAVEPQALRLEIRLSLLLMPLQHQIEQKIRHYLAEQLTEA